MLHPYLQAPGPGLSTLSPSAAEKRHDGGKFVNASLCKAPAGQTCQEMATKRFAECGAPNTEPIPAKKKGEPI